MPRLLFVFLLITFNSSFAQPYHQVVAKKPVSKKILSPLTRYSTEWDKPAYLICNTAKNALYMNAKEREVLYILNMMRTNPAFFAKNVLSLYPANSGKGELVNMDNYRSLIDTLLKMPAVNILQPDKLCYASALCHALNTGVLGLVTHERGSVECREKRYFNGECIDFGNSEPLEIVMHLLIDEGVPSLGHRYICISSYKVLGVSIKPYKGYGMMAVLDFHY